MRVKVKLFATLQKEALRGCAVKLPDGATIRNLLDKIEIDEANVGVLVINSRAATFDQVLTEEDTVTIIPPIGGG
jgi:molybdopterin converting factor small subunit